MRRRGSVLVEGLMALTILTIVVSGLMSATSAKSASLVDAQMRSAVTRHADAEIARLRSVAYKDLPREHNRNFQIPGVPGGRGRVQVKDAENGLKEVRVLTTWALRHGAEETMVVFTLIGPGEK